MKIDFNFEKHGLDKFNYVYSSYLRSVALISFLFILFAPIFVIWYNLYSTNVNLIILISVLPFQIIIGFLSYYRWNARVLFNDEGFTKIGFTKKFTSWNDISEIYSFKNLGRQSIMQLIDVYGKRRHIIAYRHECFEALEKLSIALERLKPDNIKDIPEFSHSKYPFFIKHLPILIIGMAPLFSTIMALEDITYLIMFSFLLSIIIVFMISYQHTISKVKCNGNYIEFTPFHNEKRISWSQIDSISSINKQNLFLIPHYNMILNTKNGRITVHTMNKSTYHEFEKIRNVINQ